MNLAQFLSSLSIDSAGQHTFDMLVEEGYTTIEQINGMSMQQIADIGKSSKKTIGEKTAHKIWSSLHSDRVQALLPYTDSWVEEEEVKIEDRVKIKDTLNIQIEEDTGELKIDLRGKKVLFTGVGPYSRDALTTILKRNGAIIQKGVTKETDILIVDRLDSVRTKAKKARKYETRMVTYDEVF